MGTDGPASRYAAAGVDRGRAAQAVARVAELAATTWLPPLAAGIGPFAAVWRLPSDLPRGSVLVSSTDSVGTKTKLAVALHRHRGIGEDIVNHCVNDVLTTGAEPLFFLDYFATGRIDPEVLAEVAEGMAAACRGAGCSLVGGETAEMPGVYGIGDYDLAGFLVGMAVAAIGMSYGPNAGYAINPARDFGPRVAAWLFGWGKTALPGTYSAGTFHFANYFWIPIVGPLIGAVVGVLLYDFFIGDVLASRLKKNEEPEAGRAAPNA
ncbi:MAG: AIR synthase related protein [Candidatus Dormibacteria bacterium]